MTIEFSNQEKAVLVTKIKHYFEQQLDQQIGQFDAEFLLDFFTQEVGPYYYNRGLSDAQQVLQSKLETISEAFYELEQPTEYDR